MKKAKKIIFEKRLEEVSEFARRNEWECIGVEENIGKVSYISMDLIHKIEVYLTKLSVTIIEKGFKPKYLNLNMEKLKLAFEYPEEFL